MDQAPALGGVRALRAHVETVAGDLVEGFADGFRREARFHSPWGVATDAAGHLYVADHGTNRIRWIAPDGTVATLAGNGERGWRDGPGEQAMFAAPRAVAVDRDGNVYVSDTDNDRIRRITPRGEVTTACGGARGYLDGARATANFYHPNGIAVDAAGWLYVADASNRRIRKISPGGTATTLAGDGPSGYADGEPTEARFNSPRGLALDPSGCVYVADFGNNRIRRVTPTGQVTTYAGDGRGRFRDGPAPQASFNDPCDVATDAAGNIYVADTYNHCIRLITPEGHVSTLAGTPTTLPDYADGPAQTARFNAPMGLCLAPNGDIYVADKGNHCIRRITFA